MKDQRYWAVFTPKGEPRLYSIESSEEGSVEAFMLFSIMTWENCLKAGYTVSKIKITKIEE